MANKPETVTETAQNLLRTIGSQTLSVYFTERLTAEKDLRSRPGLLNAYARLNGPSALPRLFEVAKDQAELPATRIVAVKSLSRLVEQQPAAINRAAVITAISNLLDDEDQEVRSVAAVSLSALRVREAATRLRDLTDAGQLNIIAQEETRKFLDAIEATPFTSIIPVTDRFVGREHELRTISDAFRKSKIVVLLGLNGIGKTALAAQYARQSPYELKLWLSGVRDAAPSDLDVEVMRQLKFQFDEKNGTSLSPELPGASSREAVSKRLLKELSVYTVLMVIDDYQAIADQGSLAEFVRTFTRHLPKFDCLIINRFKLKQFEAVNIAVKGLNEKDATALIESEFSALGTSIEENSAGRILKLVEGNPLLIKLVAKDTGYDKSQKLSDDQYEYFLNYILEKSIAGLDLPQQRTLEVLAQFDEPVDLRSAILLTLFNNELIISWPDALQELEQAGLIVNKDEKLFFIHSLLRDYIRRQVDGRTTRRLNQTIAYHYQNHGDDLRAIIHLARADMYAEATDLISKHDFDIEDKNYAANARNILIAEVSHVGRNSSAKLQRLILIGGLSVMLGDLRYALESYEQAIRLTQKVNDAQSKANILWNGSKVLYALGRREEAMRDAESALAIYEQLKAPNAANVRSLLTQWNEAKVRSSPEPGD